MIERFDAMEMIGMMGKKKVGVSALHMPQGLELRV